MDNGKVYESLPLPELKQEVQKSNIIQETAEQLVTEAPEGEAKALAKAEKKATFEADAAEAESKALAKAEEKAKLEADAAEAEAIALAAAEEKAKLETEAAKAEAKALAEAEEKVKLVAEAEAKAIAEVEEMAKLDAEAEAKDLAEADKKTKLEQGAEIESDEEQQWQVFQIFSCPLCTFSSPKQQITAEHMFSHIQVHNLRAPKGTLGPAFD